MSAIEKSIVVDQVYHGQRIDKALAELWPEYSRSKIQTWIEKGHILVNETAISSKYKVKTGDAIDLKSYEEPQGDWLPEPLEYCVHYKDEHIIIVNKPANLVVHPAAGNWSGTLVNGLIYDFPELSNLPRAGIVHRLDKDTTGLMVVARTLEAHTWLVQQLQDREIHRQYQAIGFGTSFQGTEYIEQPISRHPKNRLKMAVVNGGKPAKTYFKIKQDFGFVKLYDIKLETGRTHQIRVHFSHNDRHLIGDQLYGRSNAWIKQKFTQEFGPKISSALQACLSFQRQALHACKLRLMHPETHQWMQFEAQAPDDFVELLTSLEDLVGDDNF